MHSAFFGVMQMCMQGGRGRVAGENLFLFLLGLE
jgi:hypothetical protein